MEEPFACKICVSPYDNSSHIPHIIPCGGGHTVCSSCLERMLNSYGAFKCPYDNKEVQLREKNIKIFPKNLELISLLEMLETIQRPTGCRDHPAKSLDLLCFDCKVSICVLCEREKHKRHRIEVVDNVLGKANKEKQELQGLVQRAIESADDHSMIINTTEATILQVIEERYTHCIQQLERKKGQEIEEIRSRFTEMREQKAREKEINNQQIRDMVNQTAKQSDEVMNFAQDQTKKPALFGLFGQKKASLNLSLEKFITEQRRRDDEFKAKMTAISTTLNEKLYDLLNERLFIVRAGNFALKAPQAPRSKQKGPYQVGIDNIDKGFDERTFLEFLKVNRVDSESYKFTYKYERGAETCGQAFIVSDDDNTQKLLSLNGCVLNGKKLRIKVSSS